MTKIIKNGKIDTRSVGEYVYNANIQQTIIELNRMWEYNNGYGSFHILTYMNIMDRYGHNWYGTRTYKFLDSVNHKSWGNMTTDMRETIAYMIVSAIGCPDLAYDADSQKFIDMRLEGSSKRANPNALPAPRNNDEAEDIEVVNEGSFTRFKNKMINMIRWKR